MRFKHIFFLFLAFILFGCIRKVNAVTVDCTLFISGYDDPLSCRVEDPPSQFCGTHNDISDDSLRATCKIVSSISACSISYEGILFCSDDSNKYCCPESFFSGEELPDPINDNVNCPDNKSLEEGMEKAYDDGNLMEYLKELEGCKKPTYIQGDYTDSLGCYVDGKEIFCGIESVNAADSNKGCEGLKKSDNVEDEENEEYRLCKECVYGSVDSTEATGAIWTELGCIDPSPAGLITRIFQIALGVMGGIAVIRFIQIALVYQSNNPEKIAEGPQMLTSLAGGLILLILGVIVLRFLGINVLGLPEGFLG